MVSLLRLPLVPVVVAAVVAAACSSSEPTSSVGADQPTGAKAASQPATPEPVELHLVGDWLPTPGPFTDLPTYGRVTQPIVDRLTDDDLTIANLECVVFDPDTAPESSVDFAFPCPATDLTELVRTGVDVVTLGNDHITDFGSAGVEATREALERAGITAVGPSVDTPVEVETPNGPIAVLAVNRTGPFSVTPGETVAAVRAAAAATDAPLVVSIHWGETGARAATPTDNDLADRLLDEGADIVMGHGAGRLHAMRREGDAIAFMGLGRFVWPVDPEQPAEADTAVASVVLVDGSVVEACLLAATVSPTGTPAFDHREPACR